MIGSQDFFKFEFGDVSQSVRPMHLIQYNIYLSFRVFFELKPRNLNSLHWTPYSFWMARFIHCTIAGRRSEIKQTTLTFPFAGRRVRPRQWDPSLFTMDGMRWGSDPEPRIFGGDDTRKSDPFCLLFSFHPPQNRPVIRKPSPLRLAPTSGRPANICLMAMFLKVRLDH